MLMFLFFPFFGFTMITLFGETIGLSSAAIYAFIYMFLGFIVANSTCPNCDSSFFRKGIFYRAWPKCIHCGTKLFGKDGTRKGGATLN